MQAIDLVQRKLPLSGGGDGRARDRRLRAVAADVAARGGAEFGATALRLNEAADALEARRAISATRCRATPPRR